MALHRVQDGIAMAEVQGHVLAAILSGWSCVYGAEFMITRIEMMSRVQSLSVRNITGKSVGKVPCPVLEFLMVMPVKVVDKERPVAVHIVRLKGQSVSGS